jgi:hypothetical protein
MSQAKWEQVGEAEIKNAASTADRQRRVEELAAAVVEDWWRLSDELMLRFGDTICVHVLLMCC